MDYLSSDVKKALAQLGKPILCKIANTLYEGKVISVTCQLDDNNLCVSVSFYVIFESENKDLPPITIHPSACYYAFKDDRRQLRHIPEM